MVTFSHDALEHGQRALQHAYALDRLGRALSASELRSVSLASQQQWTEMLHQHASDLEEQLTGHSRPIGRALDIWQQRCRNDGCRIRPR